MCVRDLSLLFTDEDEFTGSAGLTLAGEITPSPPNVGVPVTALVAAEWGETVVGVRPA